MVKFYTNESVSLGKSNRELHFRKITTNLRKGWFLVQEEIWNLFLRTGNIETYLLLKQLENDQLDERFEHEIEQEESVSSHTKI